MYCTSPSGWLLCLCSQLRKLLNTGRSLHLLPLYGQTNHHLFMHSCKSSYTKSPATLNPFVPVGNLAMPFTMQRLQQSGELLEQHSDPLTHALARQQHGVTKGSVDAAVAEGKIPLLLTDVEGAEAARAGGLDCWCIFLAPASPEVQHRPELCITCYLRLVATGQNRLPPFTLKLIAVQSC